jgi:hypothetical protein
MPLNDLRETSYRDRRRRCLMATRVSGGSGDCGGRRPSFEPPPDCRTSLLTEGWVIVGNLRESLTGAWKLVSYPEIPVDGSAPFEPLGHKPRGLIIYTSDGYMSAQLSKPDRPKFASGDWFAGTADDYVAEASSYIAYSGPFQVDEAKQTLTHSMFVSLFPN